MKSLLHRCLSVCTTAGGASAAVVADLQILQWLPASHRVVSHGGVEGQRCRKCSAAATVEKSPSSGSKFPIWNIDGEKKEVSGGEQDEAWAARMKIPPPIENVRMLEKWTMTSHEISKVVKGSDAVHNLSAPQIEKKLMWLSTNWSFSEREVARIVQTFPPFLSRCVETEAAPALEFFIKSGYSKQDVRRMIGTSPWLLGLAQKVPSTMEFFRKAVDFSEKDIVKVLVKNPHILRFSIEENLKPKVDFFLGLGLSKPEVMNAIKDCPKVMRSSLGNCMEVNLAKFLALGLELSDIAVIVRRCPQLITRDFDKLILPKIEWLKNTLGLSDADALNYFKSKSANFLPNMETWQKTFVWFCQLLGDEGEAVSHLKKHPAFVSYKEEGLQEKVDFAQTTLQKDIKDVLNCPAYLLASFNSRILLRAAFLDSKAEKLSDIPLIELCKDRRKFCKKHGDMEFYEAQRLWNKMSKDEKLESMKTHIYPWAKSEPKEVPYF